jgi:hypothetical protein
METVNQEEFVRKIQDPEGFMVLIEDFTNGRYELHVYRPYNINVYQSLPIYEMSPSEAASFVRDVSVATTYRPPDQIKLYQW